MLIITVRLVRILASYCKGQISEGAKHKKILAQVWQKITKVEAEYEKKIESGDAFFQLDIR